MVSTPGHLYLLPDHLAVIAIRRRNCSKLTECKFPLLITLLYDSRVATSSTKATCPLHKQQRPKSTRKKEKGQSLDGQCKESRDCMGYLNQPGDIYVRFGLNLNGVIKVWVIWPRCRFLVFHFLHRDGNWWCRMRCVTSLRI